jgi:hypothetical protein
MNRVLGFEAMLMPPEDEFLQNEENEYAGKEVKGRFRARVRLFKRLGQQVNEYVAEQAPNGETDQNKNNVL